MKIWIYADGSQRGPYTEEQLEAMGLNPETPVWYEGLQRWMPAGEAPATRAILGIADPEPESNTGLDCEYVAVNVVSADAGDRKQRVEPVEAPPTFIGWSIGLTVCCCGSPFAIAALIGSIATIVLYNNGSVDKARKASTVTEWLVMIAISLGVICAPLFLALTGN